MAGLPDGQIKGKATKTFKAVLVKSLAVSLETKKRKNNPNKEQYRWVARIVIFEELQEIKILAPISALPDEIGRDLWGGFNGGPDVRIRLQDSYSKWRCTHHALVPFEARGGQFVANEQHYMAVSAWTDAPWDDEI